MWSFSEVTAKTSKCLEIHIPHKYMHCYQRHPKLPNLVDGSFSSYIPTTPDLGMASCVVRYLHRGDGYYEEN